MTNGIFTSSFLRDLFSNERYIDQKEQIIYNYSHNEWRFLEIRNNCEESSSFIIRGNNQKKKSRNGTITLMDDFVSSTQEIYKGSL